MRHLSLDEIESGLSAHLDACFSDVQSYRLTTEEQAAYEAAERVAAADLLARLDQITLDALQN